MVVRQGCAILVHDAHWHSVKSKPSGGVWGLSPLIFKNENSEIESETTFSVMHVHFICIACMFHKQMKRISVFKYERAVSTL